MEGEKDDAGRDVGAQPRLGADLAAAAADHDGAAVAQVGGGGVGRVILGIAARLTPVSPSLRRVIVPV